MATLFSPLTIGALTIKNRSMMSPMENGMGDIGGFASQRLIDFFSARAAQDVGIIMTGSIAVAPEGAGLPAQLGIYDDKFLPGLQKLCDSVHAAGSAIGAQIYHAGRQASEAITGLCPVAPSAIPCSILNNNPRELSADELPKIVQQFGDAADRAIAAGFDLVEVHFAHGYLLASFLSPHSNHRTDEYGGSLENRMRFPLQVLSEVVRRAGKRVPVTIRISVSEFLEDGLTFEDVKKICLAAQKAGAEAVSITAGCYDSIHTSIQPMFVPQGFLIPYAEQLKQILSIPVIVAGRLNNAQLIKDCIADEKADMVAIGRGLIADPELFTKIRDNRDEDIRYCVACNQGCCDELFAGNSIACMLNACASFEASRKITAAEKPQRVAIIGAGPAGLEAARVMAARGHQVVLYEQDSPGGKLELVAAPPYKESFLLFRDYMLKQLENLGVQIINKKIDSPEDLGDQAPDQVILATGSAPTMPPIPGLNQADPIVAEDVLAKKQPVGEKAVIIGGGLVGLETAFFLGSMGKAVTILEKLPTLAPDSGPTYAAHIQELIDKYGILAETDTNITDVSKSGVTASDRGFPADTIIVAAGYRSRNELEAALKEAFDNVHVIGDASKPGTIMDAVHGAFMCANSI